MLASPFWILDRRTEYEELQIKMEIEIAEHNFENARDYRDRQEQIALSIRELITGRKRFVTPRLIDSVLKSLGYNG